MLRDSDIACRYGGKEFGIIMPDTGLNGAKILAQRIRKKIVEHKFEKGSTTLKITASIGIALYVPAKDTTFGLLIKKALNALASAEDEDKSHIKTLA